jgi:hypothetical protein
MLRQALTAGCSCFSFHVLSSTRGQKKMTWKMFLVNIRNNLVASLVSVSAVISLLANKSDSSGCTSDRNRAVQDYAVGLTERTTTV